MEEKEEKKKKENKEEKEEKKVHLLTHAPARVGGNCTVDCGFCTGYALLFIHVRHSHP